MSGLLLSLSLLAMVPQQPAPAFSATLHAASSAVAPGGSVELAVEINLSAPWHIYHPILLDTGIPTTVSFDLPPGFRIDPLRFPVPKAATTGDLRYLGFEGKVIVLTRLHAPADAKAGAEAELKAVVKGLACIEACVPVQASASLRLPVASGGVAQNQKLFDEARAKLPAPLAEAPYLEGSRLVASHKRIPVSGKGEVALVIKVREGHHIQDRDPGVEGLIPTELFLGGTDGILFDKPRWPPAKVRDLPGFGNVREQSGEFAIRIPFEVADAKFEPRVVRLPALISYQTCTDAGQCFPPEHAEAFVEFEVVAAGQPEERTDEAVFRTPPPADDSAAAETVARLGGRGGAASWAYVYLLCFLGGIVLNVMPCVLPVIAVKVLGFAQQAGEERGRVFAMGLVYALGILASFAPLAIFMVKFGAGWGGIMQNATFVTILAAAVFAFALSMLNVFEFQVPGFALQAAGEVSQKEGYGGAFLNGVLTTVLATPCTGPFLGAATGLLLQLPPVAMGVGVMMIGAGLAIPYVLLSAFPAWLTILPRPGRWMNTFKELVGFTLVLVVLWLLTIVHSLTNVSHLYATLLLLCGVAVACWMLGKLHAGASAMRSLATWLGAIGVVIATWFGSFSFFGSGWDKIPWREWEPGLAEKLSAEGYTVYVDYTADWCTSCQLNKRWVLETNAIRSAFARLGVVALHADWTKFDERITRELQKHERNGVPLNVVFPAGKPEAPIRLPELLTKRAVLSALESAGPSTAVPKVAQHTP